MVLQAPFTYFGGKKRVAHTVWQRFGDVANYVEPFFGSGAVLLGRPTTHRCRIETVNDLDGMVSNFWRAVQAAPDDVAHHADWPVNENDLHARHLWLVGQRQSLQAKLEGDPEYFDAKVAGWWCWGVACWIGAEFCSGNGPWQSVDGELVNTRDREDKTDQPSISRPVPNMGPGQGVHRKIVNMSPGNGVKRQRVHLSTEGQGIHRKRAQLSHTGTGVQRVTLGNDGLVDWMRRLAQRLKRVRVTCGDWARVTTPAVTDCQGSPIGVFLDPPYSADRATVYTVESFDVAHLVRKWAIEHGVDKRYRIALCGYEGEHAMPEDWYVHKWKAHGGYGNQSDGLARENAHRERIWFSPGCLKTHLQSEFVFSEEIQEDDRGPERDRPAAAGR